MTPSEADWDELGKGGAAGVARRRLHPESPHDLFMAVRYPGGQRMLALRLDTPTAAEALRRIRRLPRSRGMDLEFTGLSDGRRELQLFLTDAALREVFNPLVTDIAGEAARASSPLACVLAFVARFEHWINLLASVAEAGLDSERRRGLFGELQTLHRLLVCGLDESEVLGAWTGPLAADQDFQFPGMAMEVKTTAARQPQTIAISSERQLDDHSIDQLLLVHLALDERRGGLGASLNQLVDRVRTALVRVPSRVQLDHLLIDAGYLPHQRSLYEEPRYVIREERLYKVEGEFPRITESELRPGVGYCSYRISSGGLDGWLIPPEEVDELLRSGGSSTNTARSSDG